MAFQAPVEPIFGNFETDEKLMNFLAFLSLYREPASILCNKTARRRTFWTLEQGMTLDPFFFASLFG